MDFKKSWNLLNVYDLMIIALLVLAIYNVQKFGLSVVLPIVAITLAAVLLDSAINCFRKKKFFLSRSAVITGLILGNITEGTLWLLILVSVLAILSKHIVKIKGRHIFNPAIFALFVALFLPVSQSWWGTSNFLLVLVLGLVIVYKLKRFHLAMPFLGVHAILMLIIFSFNLDQITVHMASGPLLFFAFYMLTEPITSPVKGDRRIIFGVLAGVFAAVLYVVWLPAMLVGALFLADLCVPILNWKPKTKHLDVPPTNPNWQADN